MYADRRVVHVPPVRTATFRQRRDGCPVYSAVIVSDAPEDEAPALECRGARHNHRDHTHGHGRYLDDYRQKLPAPIDALRPFFSDDNLPWKLGDEEKVKMNVDSIVRHMIFRLEDLLREIPILVGRKQRMFLDDPEPEILKAAMERVFGLPDDRGTR